MKLRALSIGLATAALLAASAQAQPWPRIPGRGGQQAAPPPQVPPSAGALQADLVVKAGSDTIYFAPRGFALDANALARLSAQARWLLANPYANVRLEGHGDERDTSDYALAIGDRRANAVRDFLILQGVAPHRLTVLSWGKERPGRMQLGPTMVTVGPRVRLVIQ